MNNLTNDEITIDTNVFEHLFNEGCKFNEDGNVKELFRTLVTDGIRLCVDSEGIIRREYGQQLAPMLRAADDTGIQLTLLRYWMDVANHCEIDGTTKDYANIYDEIEKILRGGGQRTDRHFVSVAFVRGKTLVSNDEIHIVVGNDKEVAKVGPRRNRLLKATRKLRPAGGRILFSREANDACK